MFVCDFLLSVIFVSLHPHLTPDNATKVCKSFSWRSLNVIDMTASRLGCGNKYGWSCSDSCCPPTQSFAQKRRSGTHWIGSICQSPAVLMEKTKIKPSQCNKKVQQYRYWKNNNKEHWQSAVWMEIWGLFLSPLVSSQISVHWQSQHIYNGIHLFMRVIIKLFCNGLKECSCIHSI